MLNHSRRAPPPAPLIRLFNPYGQERKTQVDQSSADSSPLNTASLSSVASSCDIGSFDEHTTDEDTESSSSNSSSTKSLEMRMGSLKVSIPRRKHDNVPTSPSAFSDYMIPSPRCATSASLQLQNDSYSFSCFQDRDVKGKDDTKPIVDWLGQLADSTFKANDQVLLFFQSDQGPGKRVRFDC